MTMNWIVLGMLIYERHQSNTEQTIRAACVSEETPSSLVTERCQVWQFCSYSRGHGGLGPDWNLWPSPVSALVFTSVWHCGLGSHQEDV